MMAFCKTLLSCVLRGSASRVSCAESFLRRGRSFNLRLPHGAARVTCGYTGHERLACALLPVWALLLTGPDVKESPLPPGDTSEKRVREQGPRLCPRAPRAPLRSQKPRAFFSSCKWQPELQVESASLPLALVQHSSLSE